ncbi:MULTISPECIES: SDR family NAD(P)-dependent oxidoreductase [Pacificibacter]|uniref:SDR family NAD(P)-dependent oxidoreductase n=1 Tax=Pacificibacter TaxID=1042323 RepID=UPI001C07EF52|nr:MULTISPECIES: SDR family NAD(P)-dependent oxidoreductase [Pacificibacter]MBU2937516.1 SDR family NAD(P)-dependent oxidoreductase [Pacificibacter marinus]MDO6615696.1 SDR family NAD(P)-dependent oxidoreductase [Pacificibacter sp. 1_MG-2023]
MTDAFIGKTWWIVGASDGLGAALSKQIAARGAHVILSARSLDKLTALAATLPNATVLPMDVTDAKSVREATPKAAHVDAMLYCVGTYEPMNAREWDAETVERMIDTNFTGATRVLADVVPHYVTRGFGHIMLIGSLSGYRGLPSAVGYSASKAALMHLAENLLIDLKGSGVKIQMANPGFIKTRLTAKNDFAMPQIMTTDVAAQHVIAAIDSGRFETAFPRPFAWVFKWGRYLPRALFNTLF